MSHNNRTTVDLEPARPRLLARASKSGGHGRDSNTSKQTWLDAWADPVAGVQAFGCCITTCNLCGDGDWRLVVADTDKKLKVWKGTHKTSELELQDVPVALCALQLDGSLGSRLPTVAVAAGSHIYMFQNLRPFYKFTLPPADANPAEEEIWRSLSTGQCSAQAGASTLHQLQDSGVQLATRSLQLLSIQDPKEQQAFAATSSDAGRNLSFITCMAVIRQAADEPDGVGQLVVGTEDSRVLLLGQGCTSVSSTIALPAVPALMSCAGGLDAGYRVTVAARDGWLYSIRAGSLSSTVIQLDSQPVALVTTHKQILVGTMADALHCYSVQGSKQYSIYMPASIMAMHLLAASSCTRTAKCVVVALSNGALRIYNDKTLVSEHVSSSPVSALFVGRYAREDNSLVTVTAAGGLDIKIMPRTANLDMAAAVGSSGPVPEQDVPLDVPKKTRLYVEQTQREREHAVDMHRVFQRDLVKMRLQTARALVKVLTDGQGPQAAAANLSMDVSIQGLGPRFRLLINLSNEGQELAMDLQVLVQPIDQTLCQVHTPHFVVPCLVPLLQYTFKADVTCTQPELGSGAVKVVVVGGAGQQGQPLMTALCKLPLSEPDG